MESDTNYDHGENVTWVDYIDRDGIRALKIIKSNEFEEQLAKKILADPNLYLVFDKVNRAMEIRDRPKRWHYFDCKCSSFVEKVYFDKTESRFCNRCGGTKKGISKKMNEELDVN